MDLKKEKGIFQYAFSMVARICITFEMVGSFFKGHRSFKFKPFMSISSFVRSLTARLLPYSIKHHLKLKTNEVYRKEYELGCIYGALKKIPRYTPGTIAIDGLNFEFVDSASFIFTYEEIFRKQIYKFSVNNNTPYIIDAGANIGLAVLYFKLLFPDAVITAFEPDEQVFNVLQRNTTNKGMSFVTLIKKGLWTEETELSFAAEGADGGRISEREECSNIVTIQTVKLSNYLKDRHVDFLKMDIEGAEFEVLKEAEPYLYNVSKIFVEYHSFVDKDQQLSELLQILKNKGFRVNINAPGLVSQNPFVRINTYNGMDMQLNIYGIRE